LYWRSTSTRFREARSLGDKDRFLFDHDHTILVGFGPAQSQWRRTIAAFADRLGPIEATVIAAAIEAASTELWADPARHKYWRHRTGAARRRIVATTFAALEAAGHPVPTEAMGDALADAYNALHDEELSLFPDAHETLDRLKELGIKLALITNGAAEPQCAKVRAFRPRTPFRPHPDRGRARPRQARGAGLQSCDGSARRRA
jgi:putative hydrolase of the HAD superfamily